MTADERIEKLLNVFGTTIDDLPKPADNDFSGAVYGTESLISAKKEALAFIMDEWRDTDLVPEIRYVVEEFLLDYICHLADVIDRMEIALETAKRGMSGISCIKYDTCPRYGVCDVALDCEDYEIDIKWMLLQDEKKDE